MNSDVTSPPSTTSTSSFPMRIRPPSGTRAAWDFERFAERREKNTISIALRNGKAILVMTSPTSPEAAELNAEIAKHGDFVKDIAFEVDQMDRIPDREYTGVFLPHFKAVDPFGFCSSLPPLPVLNIDHVVENHEQGTLDSITRWYEEVFRMHRFWSVDERVVHTEYSALKAHLVANEEESVQEFLDFHTSPGIQHVAFTVENIVEVVAEMKRRSVEFLSFPPAYYANLRDRLRASALQVEEEMEAIEREGILMDFDEGGYLLQIFTKPVQSRPTFFIEIIQRHNFKGFGAGNFKALFEAVELEQKKRGTLDVDEPAASE
ncbi:4-hydroxyphenylpyruvate dioxygenase [Aphelenchoides fujianensis]|nr:4-hydroxyphenylpyruvate dioxygenase [Aphelenchoides fujianensis]